MSDQQAHPSLVPSRLATPRAHIRILCRYEHLTLSPRKIRENTCETGEELVQAERCRQKAASEGPEEEEEARRKQEEEQEEARRRRQAQDNDNNGNDDEKRHQEEGEVFFHPLLLTYR